MKKQKFNIFIGTLSGIVKGVYVQDKCPVISNNLDSIISRGVSNKNPVTCMSWGETSDELLIGFQNQSVKIYDLNTHILSLRQEVVKVGDGAIVGVSKCKGACITATESGLIKVWRDSESIQFQSGNNCERMRHCPKSTVIGTGGRENDLKLWDLETGKQLFNAKNVRHDSLDMRVPIWITDLSFLTDSEHKIAVTTRHGHIRLYDTKSSQRRPVVNVSVPGQTLTCISKCPKDLHLIVGSGTGQMNLVDVRSKGLVMNKYKGFVGSVKGIACPDEHPYIASVSLDRYFRLHHMETKEVLFQEYMQSKLNCVLIRPNFNIIKLYESSEEEDVSVNQMREEKIDGAESEDELFNTMVPVVAEKKSKTGPSPRKKIKI